MNNKLRSAALIGSLLMTVTAAVPGGAVAEDALPARTYGGIPFMNGGVGVDEAQFMRSVARNYSLRLQFAGKSREFVADVSASGIEHDAAVSGAFSGGPILNSKAEVLGVATPGYMPLGFTSDRITFSPPIRAACEKILKCPANATEGGGAGERR